MFSTTCDGVVSYILQMVGSDFVSDRCNAENFNPCYKSSWPECAEVGHVNGQEEGVVVKVVRSIMKSHRIRWTQSASSLIPSHSFVDHVVT